MTRSIHDHRWVFIGDLALSVSRRESDVSLRRIEYCAECSALRVLFHSGWYQMEGDATKTFLSKFEGASSGEVLRVAPEGFKPRPMTHGARVLGRTLKDIDLRLPPLKVLPFKK